MTVKEPQTEIVKKPHWIEFIGDRSIKIEEGQTILDASLKAGIPHYHECGGNGECSTCRILVHQGGEHLSEPSDKERLLKQSIPFPSNVRLACQTFIKGQPVQLHRIIRDETDLRLYVSEDENGDLKHSAYEKELALFFLDIRNFTPFMQNYLPFDVIHIMRRLFGLFKHGIEKHAGRIIETAGDGFYAVFGFETKIEQAADSAFSAAKTILHELEEFNQHYAEKYFFHEFNVGIGLHAGQVIVGNIGIGVNNNLTVMGLPVNIASRIQTATKSLNNNLVISENFYRFLSQKPASSKTKAFLKGISEEQVLYLCGNAYS